MQIFIAHSSKDHDFVLKLAEKLHKDFKDFTDIWIDDWKLKVGDSIQDKINKGLSRSSFFIVVFSDDSVQSKWASQEFKYALIRQLSDQDITILPIWLNISQDEVPPLFQDYFAAKFKKNFISSKEYNKLIEPIKDKIKSNELNDYQDEFFEDIKYLDQIILKEKPTRSEIEIVLNLITKKTEYCDYFFKEISDLHWFKILKYHGFFDTEEAPNAKLKDKKGLYEIPHWNVLPYLEKISKTIKTNENEELIDDLINIIKNVSNYKVEKEYLDNYHIWYSFAKILYNIPNRRITTEIIELIPRWLDSKFDVMLPGGEITKRFIPKFLTGKEEDTKKAEKIIDYVIRCKDYPIPKDLKKDEVAELVGVKDNKKLIVDPFLIKEFFEEHTEDVGMYCSENFIFNMKEKIKEEQLFFERDGTYYSFFNNTFYDRLEPLNVLTYGLKEMLLVKAKNDEGTTKNILNDFFEEDYYYFPKMAIFVVSENLDKYEDLFWDKFSTNIGNTIMENILCFGDELRQLFKKFQNLSEDKISLINSKIDKSLTSITKNIENEEDKEKFTKIYKQEIYESLSQFKVFKDLYNKMKAITGIDTKLHPAIGEIKAGWKSYSPPMSKEDIFKMNNDEIAEQLSSFKTKNFWEGPDAESFAHLMRESVEEWPEKFLDDMKPFYDTHYGYIYYMFEGFKNAWSHNKDIDWNSLFDFIDKYISQQDFGGDKLINQNEWLNQINHEWIIKIIGELIENGSKNHEWSFSEKYFSVAEKIIFKLINKIEVNTPKNINDYTTYALNSPFGKIISALIVLTLRVANSSVSDGLNKNNEFINQYTKLMGNNIIEAYSNFGFYLPKFHYLNENWTEKTISEIIKGTEYWEAFMDGYFMIGSVHEKLYKLLRSHYEYAIDYNFKENRCHKFLVHHISLAYLNKKETLIGKDSLFSKVFEKFEYKHIAEIINFFWHQKDYLPKPNIEYDKRRDKILQFWELLYGRLKDEDMKTLENKKIISNTGKLAILLPEINEENVNWLLLAASNINENFNTSSFIEYLYYLKDRGNKKFVAESIGKILLKILENYSPFYEDEYIRDIVEFLYNAGEKNNANKICNKYAEKKIDSLRDIYDKYN